MSIENMIRILAGSLILISLALALTVSPYWFILTAFVGVFLAGIFTGRPSLKEIVPLRFTRQRLKALLWHIREGWPTFNLLFTGDCVLQINSVGSC